MKLARLPDGSPEIFHSLQGEGRNTGTPSIFIRSSLCNLHCHWCDTDYTWNWEDTEFDSESGRKYKREDQILTLTPEQIVDHLARSGYDSCENYVLTGGEPLIQHREWSELMARIREKFGHRHFEVETNGTIIPPEAFLEAVDQINVSPKLANSRVGEDLRFIPETLQQLADTGKADFKIVVESKQDFAELEALLSRVKIDPDHVFLMPKASTAGELERHSQEIADYCLAHGFRFSDRLHVRLFGVKRGV
ncbi:MAG: 7-carboxy-7-deazaguanine synthase QueE [Verrucomicrobiales bacterium]|nr:7-carboxy-7-deazaguanine synthase QueE [Verrucomicrobiales bacterium]